MTKLHDHVKVHVKGGRMELMCSERIHDVT